MGRNQLGFTLIEMIMTIVIAGILATMTTSVITMPVRSYFDQQRRASLVDNAEAVFWLMQRDIHRALPNSIRITNSGKTLELLHVSDGGRYRALTAAGSGDILDFTVADSSFDVMGDLSAIPSGTLVIYNLGDFSANAYTGNNSATLAATSTISKLYLTSAKQFPRSSPLQRFFIVDTPITYHCDTANSQLIRYSGYTITSVQASPPVGGTAAIQANMVSSCLFAYASSTATRNGLVTLQMTLTDSTGQSSTLVHQIHVDNVP